jgi:hypothetical protein
MHLFVNRFGNRADYSEALSRRILLGGSTSQEPNPSTDRGWMKPLFDLEKEMDVQQQPKSEKATAPNDQSGRASSEKTELTKAQLDDVTGGKLPGRWKAGDVTLTRG